MMDLNNFSPVPLSPTSRTQNHVQTPRSHFRAASFPTDNYQHKLPADPSDMQMACQQLNQFSTQPNIPRMNTFFPNVNIPSYNGRQESFALTAPSTLSFSAQGPEETDQRVNDLVTDSELLSALFNANFSADMVVSLSQDRIATPSQQPREPGGIASSESGSGSVPSSSNSKNSLSGRSTSPSSMKPKPRRRGRTKSPKSANLVCDICHQRYSRRDNLRTHQRVHSGEKPFQCKHCNIPFRWVSALRNHEALHTRKQTMRKHLLPTKRTNDVSVSKVHNSSKPTSSGQPLFNANQALDPKYGQQAMLLEHMQPNTNVVERFPSERQSAILHDSTELGPMHSRNFHPPPVNSTLSTTHSNSSSSNISYAHNSMRRARIATENISSHDDISLSEIFSITDAEVQSALDARMGNFSNFSGNRNGSPIQ